MLIQAFNVIANVTKNIYIADNIIEPLSYRLAVCSHKSLQGFALNKFSH